MTLKNLGHLPSPDIGNETTHINDYVYSHSESAYTLLTHWQRTIISGTRHRPSILVQTHINAHHDSQRTKPPYAHKAALVHTGRSARPLITISDRHTYTLPLRVYKSRDEAINHGAELRPHGNTGSYVKEADKGFCCYSHATIVSTIDISRLPDISTLSLRGKILTSHTRGKKLPDVKPSEKCTSHLSFDITYRHQSRSQAHSLLTLVTQRVHHSELRIAPPTKYIASYNNLLKIPGSAYN